MSTGPRAAPARRRPTRPGARPLRPTAPVRFDASTAYAGLVTRALAFLLDALVVNLVAVLTTGAVGLAVSVLAGDPSIGGTGAVAGALAFALWSAGYFVAGWSIGGQTIGAAVMGIRVLGADGRPLRPCRALVRLFAISIGAIPLLAGIWILLWDRRRRAFHDRVVRSVVVHVAADDGALAPIGRAN
ncbi:MAG: RDD family protein [Patulibacter sp.]|nr:RDD family protein [Patulibacter sp.]